MRLRLKLALLICPELATDRYTAARRSNESDIVYLIETMAEITGRAPSTISRLATGSGATINRLKARETDGAPAHRISTNRVENSIRWISDHWPADVEWPADIPRPNTKEEDAA